MITRKMLGIMLLAAITCISCQSSDARPKKNVPVPSTQEKFTDSAELAFQLNQKTWCSNNEALALVLMLKNGQDDCNNFAERYNQLIKQGFIKSKWKMQPNDSVTKGAFAYLVCKALDIKGGVMMHIIPSQRYAYREAVYLGLISSGAENEPLTGPEVVGIMSRAARWNVK